MLALPDTSYVRKYTFRSFRIRTKESTEESTENSLSAHPDKFIGHTGVLGTLPATSSQVTALALGSVPSLAAGAGVDADLTSHDEVVLRELANVLAYIQ